MIRQHIINIDQSEAASHIACATKNDDGWMTIDENSDCYRKIIADRIITRTAHPDASPGDESAIPKEQWPFPAKALAKMAIESDKGIGDVVERLATVTAVKMLVKLLPFDCGCSKRRDRWNAKFPIPQ